MKLREEIEKSILSLFREKEDGFFEYDDKKYVLNPISKRLISDLVGLSKVNFRSWALGMVKEVRDVNESNGRYNACAEMKRKIEEASK